MTSESALGVVLNVSVNEIVAERNALRAKNEELKQALDAVKKTAGAFGEKYFDLVWLSRRNIEEVLADLDHPSHESVVEILQTRPREVDELYGEGDWRNGFNNGMLAACRLFRQLGATENDLPEEDMFEDEATDDSQPATVQERLACYRQEALREFPMLDS